jgi:hypothetical protein
VHRRKPGYQRSVVANPGRAGAVCQQTMYVQCMYRVRGTDMQSQSRTPGTVDCRQLPSMRSEAVGHWRGIPAARCRLSGRLRALVGRTPGMREMELGCLRAGAVSKCTAPETPSPDIENHCPVALPHSLQASPTQTATRRQSWPCHELGSVTHGYIQKERPIGRVWGAD